MNFKKETKLFGFLFDNYRKISNTFPLSKDEYRDFVLGRLLGWISPEALKKAKSKLTESERDYYRNLDSKYAKRLIHTYGDEAADSLFTISVNLIAKKYGLTTFDYPTIIYHLAVDTNKMKKIIESIYEDVKSRPLNELTRSLGAGISGMAIPDYGLFANKNSIIKKFPGGIPPISRRFYEYCMGIEKPKSLVKVFEVGDDYVKMQKLKIGSLKCVKFINLIDSIIEYQYQNKGKVPKYATLNSLKWISDVSKMCDACHIPLYKLDLHEGNIGEDSDGNILLFDPIGPDLDQQADTKRLNRYQKLVGKWRHK